MDYAIIAAGDGSRLVEEGISTPKPLIRLKDTSLIERLIRIFLNNEALSVSIIVNDKMKEVQDYLRSLSLPVPFNILVKSTPGSMYSFYELSSRFLKGDHFCLTTVDTIFKEEEFGNYIQSFRREKQLDGLMAVTEYVDDEKPLWVHVNQYHSITGFSDTAHAGSRYVSGGIYCLKRTALPVLDNAIQQGMSRMRDYQRMLIREGLNLKAYPFGKIIDIDHAKDITKAELFLNEGETEYKNEKNNNSRDSKGK